MNRQIRRRQISTISGKIQGVIKYLLATQAYHPENGRKPLVINRAVIILRYCEPAVRWINKADPYVEDPGITLNSVNQERTVYLIPEDAAEDQDTVDQWIALNYHHLFEAELDGWYTDPQLWPQDRTLDLFHAWFEVEWHSVVIDTVGGRIRDDGQ